MLVDGLEPTAVEVPADAQGVARILRKASDDRCAVLPVGGGTTMELGAPVRQADIAMSLERLDGIIDQQPANLTVRAEAGITLGALNRALAADGQYLPLDPPFPDRATLGGILATNSSGSLRVRYGSARDLLLGLRVALADGQIVHGGGDVVKNVAGYDLPKLFVGSLGTLGVIVEATFKVVPLPVRTATCLIHFDEADGACDLALKILRSPLLPYGLVVLDPHSSARVGSEQRFAVVVRFGGLESAVAQQLGEVQGRAREMGQASAEILEADQGFWASLRDLPFERPIVLKIAVVPIELSFVLAEARRAADSGVMSCVIVANAVGIVLVAFDGDPDATAKVIANMREHVSAHGGHLVVQQAPRELRERVDVWGPARNDLGMMKKLKTEFDPNGILNPGRFIGAI